MTVLGEQRPETRVESINNDASVHKLKSRTSVCVVSVQAWRIPDTVLPLRC